MNRGYSISAVNRDGILGTDIGPFASSTTDSFYAIGARSNLASWNGDRGGLFPGDGCYIPGASSDIINLFNLLLKQK